MSNEPETYEDAILLDRLMRPRDTHREVIRDRIVPIDASHAATLLKDVEKEARDRITKAITIEGNGFTALLQMEREYHTDSLLGRLTFDLNGHRIVLSESVRGFDGDERKLADKLRGAATKRLADEIVERAFLEAMIARGRP
jgi:hypothetical protein